MVLPLIIDCKDITSADEFWDRYEEAVSPHWFGRNLDALWDALEGGGPGTPDGPVVFIHTNGLDGLQTGNGVLLLSALRDIAAEATRNYRRGEMTEKEGARTSSPHPCACHRDPATARLRGE